MFRDRVRYPPDREVVTILGFVRRLKEKYALVMDLPDAPVKVAHGVALGTALDFLPLPLVSIPIAYFMARLIHVNGVAAVISAMFLKFMVPVFYALNMMTGMLLLGQWPVSRAEAMEQMTNLQWNNYLAELGYSFLAGAFVNGAIAWVLVYIILRRLLEYRQRRKGIRC